MIRRFDDSHDPIILLDFDGSLVDRSKNRLHLSGAPLFREVMPNVIAMVSGSPSRPSYDPELDLDGELTIETLCILRTVPGANTYIASFSASGETDPTNYQWSIGLANHDAPRAFWEHGSTGTDAAFVPSGAGRGLPQLGVPFVLAETRRVNGLGQRFSRFYVNAEPFGPESGPLTAPSGGSTCTLKFNHSGGPFPELLGFKITPGVRTETELRASRNHCLGAQFGALLLEVESLSVGAATTSGATVIARLSGESDGVQLQIEGPLGIASSPVVASNDRLVRFDVSGLAPDTLYSYWIVSPDEPIDTLLGSFRTLPEAGRAFTIAFGGDVSNGSRSRVFTTILQKNPLLFVLNGDGHYSNIAQNDDRLYHAAYDEMLASPEPSELYRRVPVVYMPDDHDAGDNDFHAGSPGRDSACRVYRSRVPSYPLVETSPTGCLYHFFDVGDVRFIVTDQRMAASPKTATDNASKTVLGATQKAWFKDLLSNSPGKFIVWICTRLFGGVQTAGADHWGGYSTERAELIAHVDAVCPERFCIIAADAHCLAIDDGSGHDFLPGGGRPIPIFQAAPLDRTPDSVVYGSASYSEGWFNGNGQFGTMTIEPEGSSLHVTWKGFDLDGNELVTHSFDVEL